MLHCLNLFILNGSLYATCIIHPKVYLYFYSSLFKIKTRFLNSLLSNLFFLFSFATSNGIIRNESGKLRDAGSESPSLAVQGIYQYTYNGTTYIVRYTADENGFVPNITTQTIGVRIGPDAVASLIGPG